MRPDLVLQAQRGDHDAYEELARDAVGRLYGTARLILLRQDLAEAAAQDALITAWRDIRGLRDPAGLDPWLLGLLVRSRRNTTGVDAGTEAVEESESRLAFNGLTQDARTILALAFFADLSVPDAAVALGVPHAAAEAGLDDALSALRSALSIDDRTESKVDLEWRLRSWLSREAAPPDLTAVLEAVTAASRSTPQRRHRFVPARTRRSGSAGARRVTRRRLGVALATVLALTVAVGGGVAITRIVRPPVEEEAQQGSPRGLIRPTGDISSLAGSLEKPAIAVLADGRVLVVGLGEELLGGIVYDPATDTYGETIRDHVLRRGSTATTLQSGLVLMTGGTFPGSDTSADTAVLFDPFSKTFATTNHMTLTRAEHTATLLGDGRVLIAGGRHHLGGGSARLVAEGAAEIYDPATGTFGATGTMVQSRADHTATMLRDGRVLIAGGSTAAQQGGQAIPTQAEIFDPATGQFQATGSMSTPRGRHSATLLVDGRVLIVGGSDRIGSEGESPHPIASAEIFDPATGTFVQARSLVTERAGHTATLLADGRVLVAGGSNDFGEPLSTEIFDAPTGTFAVGPFAAAPHRATLAPLVTDGRVLLTGSGPGASELFDPAAGGVAAVASASPDVRHFRPIETSVMRNQPTLVGLDDGRTLILGGWGMTDGEPIREAEIFDPSTGLVSPAGTLLQGLSEVVTTRLPDGRIFIVGNAVTGAGAAEIFDPATGTFGPAPDQVTEILRDRHPMQAFGLPDGRLMVSNGYDTIQSLDVVTATLGPPILACEYPRAAIALDAGRVLTSCGSEFDAVIADPATGTASPTGLRYDRAIPLDAHRIALARAGYLFGEPAAGTLISDPITWLYDPLDLSVQQVPENVKVGETAVVSGDRILSFGGSTTNGSSDASFAIDTRSWMTTDLGPMLAPRSGTAATILRDGRVLIVGGARRSPDRTDPIPSGAELLDLSMVP